MFGSTKMQKKKKKTFLVNGIKVFQNMYVTSKKHISKNLACIVFNKIFQRLSLTHVCLFYINKMAKWTAFDLIMCNLFLPKLKIVIDNFE